MSKNILTIDVSYSQLCLFASHLKNPFNDWSERAFGQGFTSLHESVSFRTLETEGEHTVNLYVNEIVPTLENNCIRAFRIPFQTLDGKIEIASISDSISLHIKPGEYSLQVEFLNRSGDLAHVNLRLNRGTCAHQILKADEEIDLEKELELFAKPAD